MDIGISKIANETYKIGAVEQTNIYSNTVTINITESTSFSLVAKASTSAIDEINEDLVPSALNGVNSIEKDIEGTSARA